MSVKNEGTLFSFEADIAANQIVITDISANKQIRYTVESFIRTIHEDDLKKFKRAFLYVHKQKKRVVDINFRVCVNCMVRNHKIKGFVHDIDGNTIATGLYYDVDSVRAQAVRLDYLEKHDVKTGLINTQTLDAMFEDIAQFGMYPQTLIIADIDCFKDINDTLGYHSGNTLIKNVADVLKDCFFDAEMIARISGGEYCAVYAGKSKMEIENKINEAQMLFHSMYLNLIKAEVSFGYAVSESDSDFCTLYSQAAQKLRRARNARKVLRAQSVIESLNGLIGQRAKWGKRQTRLQSLSMKIAKPLGCTEECEATIKVLAKIADIGLIGIDEELIKRRISLTDIERSRYMEHTQVGREIIAAISEVAEYETLYVDIFKRYDEWQDAIALPSRIIAATMGFDDIVSTSLQISFKQIKKKLSEMRGSQYCPDVVDAILAVAAKHYA